MPKFSPEAASPAEQAILLAWLSAEDAAARARLLEAPPTALTPALAEGLWALAQGGPSYGGDREHETRIQADLLALVVEVARRSGANGVLASALRQRAHADAELDDTTREAWLAEAAEAGTRAKAWGDVYQCELDLAALLLERHRAAGAFDAFERAVEACMKGRHMTLEAQDALTHLSRLASQLGKPQAALAALGDWLAHCRERGDRRALGDAEALLGAQLVTAGRLEEGKSHLLAASSLLGEMGDDAALARLHLHLMVANYSLGEPEAAMRHLQELMRRRERLQDVSLEAEIEAMLGHFPTDGF